MVLAILRKEILGGGRHGRYYIVRGGYLLLLACVTIPAILYQIERLETAASFASSRLGQEFTIPFGILQFVLVVLLAPALSMNALATERSSGGLELLHVAGVGPVSLIVGKFASRMMWLLLFVFSGLPLFMAGTLMGGVGLETAALLVAHSAVAAAVGTGIGFSLSGGFKQTVPAMVLAYLFLASLYIGPPLGLVFYDEVMSGTHIPDDWYAWSCPIPAIILTSDGSVATWVAWGALVPQAMVAFVFTLPSLFFARPREGMRSLVPERKKDVAHSMTDGGMPMETVAWRPKIHGNPIAWRDARAARRALSARILRISYVLVGGLITTGALLATAAKGHRDADFGRIAIFLLVGGAGIVSLVVGSGAIAEERERRSMPLLRLSRLTAFDVLSGKLWGLFVYLWPLAVLPVGTSILFFYDTRWVPALVTVTAGVMLFAGAAIGLAFSSLSRRPATAIGLSITFAIVYVVVPPMLVKFGQFHRTENLLYVFDPLLTVVGIVDQFGRNYDGAWSREEFWLSLIGLLFLTVVGVFSLWVSLVALYRREEDAS